VWCDPWKRCAGCRLHLFLPAFRRVRRAGRPGCYWTGFSSR